MDELKQKVMDFIEDKVKPEKLEEVKKTVSEVFDANKDGKLSFDDLQVLFTKITGSIKLDKLGDFTKGLGDLKDKFFK